MARKLDSETLAKPVFESIPCSMAEEAVAQKHKVSVTISIATGKQ